MTLVWIGFPLVVTGGFLGSQLTNAMGFSKALLTIVIGNLVLFGYVGAQSAIAARTGHSFSLLTRGVFGPNAARLVSGFLSMLVVGWFAVQTGLAGQGLHDMLGWSATLSCLVTGILFTALTMMGIRVLSIVGVISVPFFIRMGLAAVAITLHHYDWASISSFAGSQGAKALHLGVGITMVISLFIDSGTLTADFTRWAKNPRHALIATASAFPLAHGISMVLGALVTAAGTASDGNFAAVVSGQDGWLVPVAAAFFVLNCASVTMHCLYNAATGWSAITGSRFKVMTILFGTIGTVAAIAGVWDLLIEWLSLLGIVVPGIGGVIIAHFWRNGLTLAPNPRAALGGWGAAIVVAAIVNAWAPQLSVSVIAMLVAFVTFWLLDAASSPKTARASLDTD